MIVLFVIGFFVFVDLLVLGIVFWFDQLNTAVLLLTAALMLLMVVLGVLFSALTITLDPQHLQWQFAFGFWKRAIDLADIKTCKRVRNPWYYGWGIRRIPGGWLYGVSGFQAIEIELQDGKRLRLGSDEPGKLLAALEKAVAAHRSI